MFCARCGKPLPEAASFCPSCGAAVTSAPDAGAAVPASGATHVVGAAPPTWPPVEGAPGPPLVAAAVVAAPAAVRYGGFWRRVLAFVIDGLIIGAVMMPFGLGLGLAQLSTILSEDVTSDTIASLVAASLFVWFIRVIVSWLYGAGFESSRFQATPGKMLLGVQVTDLEGRRISFLRATGRQLGKWVSGLILGIGYLLVAFSDRKQGLHDFMAGTLVRRQG